MLLVPIQFFKEFIFDNICIHYMLHISTIITSVLFILYLLRLACKINLF